MNFNKRFKFINTDLESMFKFQQKLNEHNLICDNEKFLNYFKKSFHVTEELEKSIENAKISTEKININSKIEDNLLGFNQILDIKKNKIKNIYGFYIYSMNMITPYFCLIFMSSDNDLSLIYGKYIGNIDNRKKEIFEYLFDENLLNEDLFDEDILTTEETLTEKFIETLTYINYITEDINIKNVIKDFEKKYNINLN